eukprot:11202537-Lingulodinium_polyedra.AAC.1
MYLHHRLVHLIRSLLRRARTSSIPRQLKVTVFRSVVQAPGHLTMASVFQRPFGSASIDDFVALRGRG